MGRDGIFLRFHRPQCAVGDKIFCLNESGVCFVLRARDKFELLHTNELGGEICIAAPALAGDRFPRGQASLLHSRYQRCGPLIEGSFEVVIVLITSKIST